MHRRKDIDRHLKERERKNKENKREEKDPRTSIECFSDLVGFKDCSVAPDFLVMRVGDSATEPRSKVSQATSLAVATSRNERRQELTGSHWPLHG